MKKKYFFLSNERGKAKKRRKRRNVLEEIIIGGMKDCWKTFRTEWKWQQFLQDVATTANNFEIGLAGLYPNMEAVPSVDHAGLFYIFFFCSPYSIYVSRLFYNLYSFFFSNHLLSKLCTSRRIFTTVDRQTSIRMRCLRVYGNINIEKPYNTRYVYRMTNQ